MRLENITHHAAKWLSGYGPKHDVVISSRMRLARNLLGMPFPCRCNEDQKREVCDRITHAIQAADISEDLLFLNLEDHSELDRALLVERHLISRQHAQAGHTRFAVLSSDERISFMINEEDHLRIQLLHSGLHLREAFEEINRIDDLLSEQLDYAFLPKYGYLTACPTNLGTGLRVSVMLHLPGLKLSGEINRAMQASRDLNLAIRGIYGEGTQAVGDFFQISNQLTLGKSEEQIVDDFTGNFIPAILDYERKARQQLMKNHQLEIEDRIYRALAVTKAARLISSDETLDRLSMIRLGINLHCIDDVDLDTVNELYLLSRPAHIQKLHDTRLTPRQRDEKRSTLLRDRLLKARQAGKGAS